MTTTVNAPGVADEYEVFEPASGEVLARVRPNTEQEIEAVVALARIAAEPWDRLGPIQRGAMIRAFAQEVRGHLEELALLDSHNAGSPVRTTRAGVEKGAATLEFFAGLAIELTGKTIPATPDHLHFTVRVPYGLVAVLTAFNHPAMFAMARAAAAMVAGNCVLLKPASATPLSAIRLAEIAAETLPPGVFNVVVGGAAAGRALVAHPDIRRVSFTGSVETGLEMQRIAAESGVVKHVSLQLGGKNPLVILPDADLMRAVDAAVEGMNFTRVMGQSCGSTSRVFVPESLREDFVALLVERVSGLSFGDPTLEATDLGPLVSRAHRDRVSAHVDQAIADGVRVLLGGQLPGPPFDRGFYYPPTILEVEDPSKAIANDEVFGPVLAVIPWTDEEQMLTAVNNVRYGLTASIFTENLNGALHMASRIRCGYVWVNDVERRWLGIPFGGVKDSGTTTEYSVDELLQFTQNKTVSIALT